MSDDEYNDNELITVGGDIKSGNKPSMIVSWIQFIIGTALFVVGYVLMGMGVFFWVVGGDDIMTGKEEIRLISGIMCTGLGWLMFQTALTRILTFPDVIITITTLLVLIGVSVTIGVIYLYKWGVILWLNEMIYADTDAFYETAKFVLGIYLCLTMFLYAVTLSVILVRIILMRKLYKKNIIEANGYNGDTETNSLLNNGQTQATEMGLLTTNNNNDDNDVKPTKLYFDDERIDVKLWKLSDKIKEFGCIFIFIILGIPIWFVLNSIIVVSDWHRLDPTTFIGKLTKDTSDTWTIGFQFECALDLLDIFIEEEICIAKIYFDVIVFCGFIMVVCLISWISMKSTNIRNILLIRIPNPFCNETNLNSFLSDYTPISMCIGEIIFWILWVISFFLIFYYFVVIHLWNSKANKTATEIWARTFGILSLLCLSMQLFTITRIRLWNDVFHVSWERLVGLHRTFGFFMLLFAYLHLALWLGWFGSSSVYTLEYNGPFDGVKGTGRYVADNWTIDVMYYWMIFLTPIIYIILSFYLIRRKYFELFYYSHLFGSFCMITMILWHASQAWRYIIPPLILYTIDRCIRFINGTIVVQLTDIKPVGLDNGIILKTEDEYKITKISFKIGNYNYKNNESNYYNLNYKPGQYVFINIPNISLFEWHPYTLASSPVIKSESTYICAKSFGNNQFSDILYNIATKVSNNEVNINDIELHIDGPYGKPFKYNGYNKIILIAGGIGITPIHSIFDTLLSIAIKQENNINIPTCDLIWIVKQPHILTIFNKTWIKYQSLKNLNNFTLNLFVTQYSNINNEQELIIPNSNNTTYKQGRPNWNTYLVSKLINNKDNINLVFACGPNNLMKEIEFLSTTNGAQFHSESFEF